MEDLKFSSPSKFSKYLMSVNLTRIHFLMTSPEPCQVQFNQLVRLYLKAQSLG